MGYEDDLISALNQQVRLEVVENYFRERRIIEEEIAIAREEVCAYLGALARWQRLKAALGAAVVCPDARTQLLNLAGLNPPDENYPPPPAPKGLGLTRRGRYKRYIRWIYTTLWEQARKLTQHFQRVAALVEEVNSDIQKFEASYDLMLLASFLRNLDPDELLRRQVLGGNFTPKEMAAAAEAMSFPRLDATTMGLEPPESPAHPARVIPPLEPLLARACRLYPDEVRRLVG